MIYDDTLCPFGIAHRNAFTYSYTRTQASQRSGVYSIPQCYSLVYLYAPTQNSRIQLDRDFDSRRLKRNRDHRTVRKIGTLKIPKQLQQWCALSEIINYAALCHNSNNIYAGGISRSEKFNLYKAS